uniref:Uncharacterized protein n=1 Tax=Anguilla anguilla TaxID=7936 RepID=A0A0E9WE82_ANGAN
MIQMQVTEHKPKELFDLPVPHPACVMSLSFAEPTASLKYCVLDKDLMHCAV